MKSEVCPNCGHYMQSEREIETKESFHIDYYHCDVCGYDSTEEHSFIAPLTDNYNNFYHYSEEI